MAPGIYKSFKKDLKKNFDKAVEFIKDNTVSYGDTVVNTIEEHVNKIVNTEYDNLAELDKYIVDIDKDYEISNDYITNKYFSKLMRDTYNDVKKECYQAMESVVHNLNTLHSRAGAQVNKLPSISEMMYRNRAVSVETYFNIVIC